MAASKVETGLVDQLARAGHWRTGVEGQQEAPVRALADKTLDLFRKAGTLVEQSVDGNFDYIGEGFRTIFETLNHHHQSNTAH